MSEDPGLNAGHPWPSRSDALASLPDALQPERLAGWPVVIQSTGIDETSMTLLDVDHTDGEVCIQRQHWLFDEDTRSWTLDQNEEWWLPNDAAERLADLLTHRG